MIKFYIRNVLHSRHKKFYDFTEIIIIILLQLNYKSKSSDKDKALYFKRCESDMELYQ